MWQRLQTCSDFILRLRPPSPQNVQCYQNVPETFENKAVERKKGTSDFLRNC